MCTVTAFYRPVKALGNQFQLIVTMNRDEAIDRAEGAVELQKNAEGALEYWYPTDAATKGTWFGVGSAGLVMTLLNRYQDSHLSKGVGFTSRGAIIPSLLACSTITEIIQKMSPAYCGFFQPFDLLVFSGELCYQFAWDGGALRQLEHAIDRGFFYTSSSIDIEDVTVFRRNHFLHFVNHHKRRPSYEFSRDVVSVLHGARDQKNPSWSINMQRPGRQTRSICQAQVAEAVVCHYWPLAINASLSV